ncbi:iron ABC transporter, partial [Rhodococcus rhodochrous]
MTAPATTYPAPDRPTVPSRPALRLGPVSLVWRPRIVVVCLALVVATFLLLCVGLGRGDYPLSVPQVLTVLAGGGEQLDRFIVLELRLPRGLAAVLVGAALAVSGALTQTVSRNPLASPDILGITAGASAAAVALIVATGSGVLGGGAR